MRLLLDECLPVDYRHDLAGHEVHTVQWAGLKGCKNGELLKAAETAGYDILLTVDHGIPYQTAAEARKIALIVIRARTNQLEDLQALTHLVLQAIRNISPG